MSFSPRYCVALTSILQHTWAFSLAFLCTSRVITRGDHCARVRSARHSQTSRNPFRAGHVFRGFLIHAFATACQLARPPVRIRPICSAFEGFYFQASNGSVPSPLLGMTTTATGLLCRRDFHPLEWQLASLHQIRTCGFPAYGSHLGSNRQSNCRMRSGACGTRAWR